MEKEINLPEEYFEKEESNLLEEDVTNKELLSLESFPVSVPQEEKQAEQPVSSNEIRPILNVPEKQINDFTDIQKPANTFISDNTSEPKPADIPFSNNNSIENSNSLLTSTNTSANSPAIEPVTQNRPSFNQEELVEEISNIENKISGLEKQIENLNLEEKNNFNNTVQQSDNNFNNTVQLGDKNYNDFNDEGDSVVEVFSNKNTLQKQYLKRDINLLKKQKDKLVYEQQKALNGSVPFTNNENFVPNFSNESFPTGNDALQKSIETEKFLGNEGDNPVVVNDKNLGSAVISESQGNLQNAIEDHGGMDNAIKDSITNQNSYTQISPKAENIPDNNAAMVNNTQKILEAVTSMSSILKELASSLKSGITGTSKSSNVQQSAPVRQGSTDTPTQPQSNNSNKQSTASKPISNLKGDLPLSEDFPTGFDLSQLGGSNLLTRT